MRQDARFGQVITDAHEKMCAHLLSENAIGMLKKQRGQGRTTPCAIYSQVYSMDPELPAEVIDAVFKAGDSALAIFLCPAPLQALFSYA